MRERLTGYCHKLSAVTEWNNYNIKKQKALYHVLSDAMLSVFYILCQVGILASFLSNPSTMSLLFQVK